MYALVFVLTACVALALLGLVPDRGVLAARARLQALEAAGPGLVHVADARVWQIRDRRKARARRRQMARRALFLLRHVLLMFACGVATGLACRYWGTERTLLAATLAGLSAALLLPVYRFMRVRHVSRQIPGAMDMLAAHLEASNSLFGAIDAAAGSAPWPIRAEFARTGSALRNHATVEQAAQAFAARNPVPEAHLLAKILSAPERTGPSLAQALRRAAWLLAAFAKAESEAATWQRLRLIWVFLLTAIAGELAILGLLRSERPLGPFLGLSAVSVVAVAAWWIGRRKVFERTRLEGRLGLLHLDGEGPEERRGGPTPSGIGNPRALGLIEQCLLLGCGSNLREERLSGAAVRAVCHVACLLGAGLSLESAIGAVALRPGKRGRLEQELFVLLQEIRSGMPPHAAALALSGRCEAPELRNFATALSPGKSLADSMEEAARKSLGSWPARARAAAMASGALAAGAAVAAIVPLLALAFAP